MPTIDEVQSANKQEMDNLHDLIDQLKREIKGLERDLKQTTERLDSALDKMRKAREELT